MEILQKKIDQKIFWEKKEWSKIFCEHFAEGQSA
jgi:hypothetical protein